MSLVYQYIMCKHAYVSIIDLHDHPKRYHNPEDLSRTIIGLQGFKLWKHMDPTQEEYKEDQNLQDTNNTIDNLYINLFVEPTLQSTDVHESKVLTLPNETVHNDMNYLINYKQFDAWERELNKREEIKDADFLETVTHLCQDLSKKKARRGRKKKLKKTENAGKNPEKTETSALMRYIQNVIGVDSMGNIVEQPCHETFQMPTTSHWDPNDSVSNEIIKSIVPIQVNGEVQNTENSGTMATIYFDSNENQNVALQDLQSINDFWNSIIHVNESE